MYVTVFQRNGWICILVITVWFSDFGDGIENKYVDSLEKKDVSGVEDHCDEAIMIPTMFLRDS